MKIKLQEALDLIHSADVVKLLHMDCFIIPIINFDLINGDPLNEFMYVSWEDNRDEYGIRVTEGKNTEVERDGHKLTFIDNEGNPFELQLFREVPILV